MPDPIRLLLNLITQAEEDEMLVPHSDFAATEGPQPMEGTTQSNSLPFFFSRVSVCNALVNT